MEIERKKSDAIDFVNILQNEVIGNFIPKNVVVDIAETIDRGFIIIESNDICCSGRYKNNVLESFPLVMVV